MLSLISLCFTIGIVAISFIQFLFALAYAVLLSRSNRSAAVPFHPKAAIVLAVRGSDPALVENMSALLDQDYPEFRLFIIVDSEQDSAWPDVRRLQALAPQRIDTLVLRNHLPTCSLKCSSLGEAVEQIDESFEVIAFLDGDAPPHRTWLRELIEPLANPAIGVTTGNRWYTPSQCSWGAMVRYFWNAGAVVQVWLNGIVWAGSMAMRREVIDRVELVAAWRKSLSVDGTVKRQIRKSRLRPKFVPSIIMPNRENITISNFTPWSERQLVAARSSGSGWSVVLFHAFSIAMCVVAPLVICVVGCVAADQRIMMLGLIALGSYWGGAMLSTIAIEIGMQSVFARNQVQAKWLSVRAVLCYLPALILCHVVYFTALFGASVRNKVSWRGIDYEISDDNEIRMVEYRPFVAKNSHPNRESII